jgi:hypothetical protein
MAGARLRYRKAAFIYTLILLSIALTFLNVLFGVTVFKDPAIIFVAILVSAVVLFVLGISPFLTDHILSDTSLELHQGWYFRASIPLSNIVSIQVLEKGPRRTGVFFEVSGRALYVTTQRNGLFVVSLREPQRFGFALGKKAGRVYFDTVDRNVVLRRLEDKFLTPSNPDLSS